MEYSRSQSSSICIIKVMNCPHCNVYMRTKRGLTQHISQVKACFERQQASLGIRLEHEDRPPAQEVIRPAPLLTAGAHCADSLARQSIPHLSARKSAPLSPDSVESPHKRPYLPTKNTGGVARMPTSGHGAEWSKEGYSEEEVRRMQDVLDKHPERTYEEWRNLADGFHSKSSKSSRSGPKSVSMANMLARIAGQMPLDEESDAGMHHDDDSSEARANERDNLEATEEEFLMQEILNPGGIPLNEDVVPGEEDFNNDGMLNKNTDTQMRDRWVTYCANAEQHNFPQLTDAEQRGIRLLEVLRRKKTSLDTYEEIMLWHLQEIGILDKEERLKDAGDHYISRSTLLSKLSNRYNFAHKFAFTKRTVLPDSKQTVDVVCHDAWGCFENLLTDPRLTDDDFWFFDDNPFGDPPETFSLITDLHSGMAYRAAHKLYKKKPNQIVLPVVFYLDGANTGHMKNMPITALKMTLGIFTRKYRDLDHAWQVLGHVMSISKNQARAKKILKESKHIEAGVDMFQAPADGNTAANKKEKEDPAGKAKDLHKMLDVILESYREIQEKGFVWDLRYRGKTYNVEFVPFLIFMKCDTQEGDALCGSFLSRGAKVKQLCRYCQCPNEDTANPQAFYDPKTVPLMRAYTEANDIESLTKLSQHPIDNAFYKIRFSPINNRGIHGATPSEMLHAILLGTFQMMRDVLFEQIGNQSQMAHDFEGLAMLYGKQCARQSERGLPKCSFNSGIREGKLNAKEYRGILLVMALVFRSTMGREKLRKYGFSQQRIEDWLNLLEVLLSWEAFLCQSAITRVHVAKLSKKNRYLMWLITKVAARSSGMGLRTMKFHAITHLAADIALYGVPLEFDTGSNESGHKPVKVAAKSTQKNESTFDIQTATRLDEHHVLDLAMMELDGRKLWRYYRKSETMPRDSTEGVDDNIVTGGTKINIFADKNGKPCFSLGLGAGAKKPMDAKKWDKDVVDFLYDCQMKIRQWGQKSDELEANTEFCLGIYSDHTRHGKVFRGHPLYRGDKHWRDWVMIDWDGVPAPAHIWCFVDLRKLPDAADPVESPTVQHGNCELHQGVFAVIESGDFRPRKQNEPRSRLFEPLVKEGRKTGADARHRRRFYLADTEAISDPCFVIPDIGSTEGKTYFRVKSREDWILTFEDWLDEPYPDAYKNDPEAKQK